MAAMPGMDEDDAKPKGKGKPVDLAIIMGGKPKGAPPADEESDNNEDGLPHGFEEAAAEAFPDLAGDPERLHALKRLIMLCTDSY